MLNPENACALPATRLQPPAPTYTVKVPVITYYGVNTIQTEYGYLFRVFYDVQQEVWRTSMSGEMVVWLVKENTWRSGSYSHWLSIKETLPRPTQFRDITLPSYPLLPVDTQEIPRQIHHLWIGTSVPNQNIMDTIARNTTNTADFRVTLHTDVNDELFTTLANALSEVAPNVTIAQLKGTPFFDQFQRTDIYKHYLSACTAGVPNYSAASDMLRYPLTNHYGGIYMDVDDSFSTTIGEQAFMAAGNDVLLGPLVNHYGADFRGYNSSIFASLPNNPVLASVTQEMTRRCDANPDFFKQPRPQLTDQSSPEFKTYSTELFRLTGPQVFNDVLARERPDYYSTIFNLADDEGSLTQYDVYDTVYAGHLTKVAEHYFPFAERAPVEIGMEHSWVST